jgi:hypothetical protein
MKLLFTIIAVVLYASVMAQAPVMGKKDFRVNEGVNRLVSVLDLSKEQSDKLRDIENRHADKLVALNVSAPGSEAKAIELKDVLAAREAEIKQLLTNSQYKKYLEMQESVLKSMKERRMKHIAERNEKLKGR